MDFNTYQEQTERTAPRGMDDKLRLASYGLGLTGEAGEVADIIKKEVAHGHPRTEKTVEDVKKELGDLLWYAARTASEYGLTLSNVASANLNKLRQRYPQGFSAEASINRIENTAK